ncbi:hypothetical protein QU487_06300 [Crenobacter sp. SG2305]|uniref:hypothetical protein n=1 Tax=Crenobacter oryzisoli TaxID=3056844 RepID=UPI0025AA700F|nr:hypothetical protein [Crenobacter sp. SG2305]MDN0082363.1 hypothetical protein [Crenobacter sp. SG2305]
MENQLPSEATGANKIIKDLLDLLDHKVVGLIGRHHGREAMQRATHVITEAKGVLNQGAKVEVTAQDQDGLLQCFVPSLLDDHDDYAQVPEWQWIEGKASFAHVDAADRIVHVASFEQADIPTKLQPAFAEAKSRGLQWILFYIQ